MGQKSSSPKITITLNQTELIVEPGSENALAATISPHNIEANLIWNSSDESVASVSDEGIVTAKTSGYALITVTTEDGKYSASCFVSVYNSMGADLSNFEYKLEQIGYVLTGIKDKTITELLIPDCVTSIGDSALQGCSLLKTVIIHDNVVSIGECVFDGCTSLENITVGSANPEYKSIDGNLYTHDGLKLIQYGLGKRDETFVVPSAVKTIDQCAFSKASHLKSVNIPDNVSMISESAFKDCEALANIVIGNGVVLILPNAFTNTAYYNNPANWENGNVLYIGEYLIKADTSLTGVYSVKDGTKVIGEDAFKDCSSLESINLPETIMFISSDVIEDSEYYNDPNNWESNALYVGNYLIKVKPSSSKKFTVKEGTRGIANLAFAECVSLKSINLPNTLVNIGIAAFSNCTSLESMIIPDSVVKTGSVLFSNCSSLESVTLGSGISRLESFTFAGCSSLTSVTIPNSVTSINQGAFYFCQSLESVTIPDSVKTIGSKAFYGCPSLRDITIPNGVTSIGECAFYSSHSLVSINVPDSVTTIGDCAFFDCLSLMDITFGNGVTSIGSGVLDHTPYMEDSDNWEDGALYIGTCLIAALPLEGEFDIRENTTAIADCAFADCDSITSVAIPDGVTHIGPYTFSNCTSLTLIKIPSSVTSIGDDAFNECEGLRSVHFTGTKKQWNQIDFGNGCSNPVSSFDAIIHFGDKTETRKA